MRAETGSIHRYMFFIKCIVSIFNNLPPTFLLPYRNHPDPVVTDLFVHIIKRTTSLEKAMPPYQHLATFIFQHDNIVLKISVFCRIMCFSSFHNIVPGNC